MVMSSQEFRNIYENFYNAVRQYLWPYNVVERLAEAEEVIYTSFPDLEELKAKLYKLRDPIKEASEEFDDPDLSDLLEDMIELAEDADPEQFYFAISRVEEDNPDVDKEIKSEESEESDEEEGELENDYSFSFTEEENSES